METLLFFNEQQRRYRDLIVASIETYGEPKIHRSGDFLRVHLRDSDEVQNLFALETKPEADRLVGFALYTRAEEDTLVLIHIGVDREFAHDGERYIG